MFWLIKVSSKKVQKTASVQKTESIHIVHCCKRFPFIIRLFPFELFSKKVDKNQVNSLNFSEFQLTWRAYYFTVEKRFYAQLIKKE